METINILSSYNLDIAIKALGVILAFVSIMFAIKTFNKNIKVNKAKFLLALHDLYLNDKKMAEIFNSIEWGDSEQSFEQKFYAVGENVYKLYLEKFFALFEYLLLLKEKRILTESETTIYDYMITRIITNSVVCNYFNNVLLRHIQDNKYINPYPRLTNKIKPLSSK
jgi:hypothetical protein